MMTVAALAVAMVTSLRPFTRSLLTSLVSLASTYSYIALVPTILLLLGTTIAPLRNPLFNNFIFCCIVSLLSVGNFAVFFLVSRGWICKMCSDERHIIRWYYPIKCAFLFFRASAEKDLTMQWQSRKNYFVIEAWQLLQSNRRRRPH